MIPFLSSWGRASKGPPLPVPAHEAWCMAQQRWQLASAVSTPPLPRVRSIGMPADPLVPSAPFTAGVSRRNAPATTYSVHLAVSRETYSEPSRWYSDSTDEIPLSCPRGQPDTPMQRHRLPNPIEGVRQPTARLRAERRHSTHEIRCITDFCSSRQSVHEIPRRIHRSEEGR